LTEDARDGQGERDRAAVYPVVASALLGLIAALVFGPWFPPAADGAYFDKLAQRIARGSGYTWLWPDGTVTPVAHYPVGFSALEAVGYRLFGAGPTFARLVIAAAAVVAVVAGMRLLATFGSRAARAGGWLLAAHPALVFYVPAMMTEGLVGSLTLIGAALAVEVFAPRSLRSRLVTGIAFAAVLGAATYLRPQSIVFAPLFFAIAAFSPARQPRELHELHERSNRRRVARAAAAAVVGLSATLLLLAPWTARNCARMHACALVSVNGGWNLLIGAETTSGAWQQLETPDECRTVWDEAEKDACFGRIARREIASAPLAWLARAPAKWSATFDYFGAAAFYLHVSSPERFAEPAKERLGAVETIYSRLVLLAALLALARAAGPIRRARLVVAALAAPLAFVVHAWPAYLVAGALAATLSLEAPLFAFAASVLLGTFAIHAVFFGAGRYGLPAAEWVVLLAATGLRRSSLRPEAVVA
jgi:hypothetical protein